MTDPVTPFAAVTSAGDVIQVTPGVFNDSAQEWLMQGQCGALALAIAKPDQQIVILHETNEQGEREYLHAFVVLDQELYGDGC